MNRSLMTASAIVACALSGGCAQFQSATSPVAPSGEASVATLLGDWASSSDVVGTVANKCSDFRWNVTAQSGNSLSGTFSATCGGGVTATGAVSGQVNGSDVPYQISGTASAPGIACPFTLGGTAHIDDGNTIRVPYAGSTCFGPVQGEETLHRPTQPAPAPAPPAAEPAPEPAPAPPAENPFHVGPGPLTAERANQVITATGNEFPGLTSPRATEAEGVAAADELLRRMIWHLHLAGYDAGRQRNPSGAISSDKLTIFINGGWHAYDCFRNLGGPGQSADIIFYEVFPAGPVPDGGIPD